MQHSRISKMLIKEKELLFFNFLFWFAHWVFWLLMEPRYLKEISNFIFHLIGYIIPFISTLGLSYTINRLVRKRSSLISIVIIVISISFLCGSLWIIQTQFLVYLLWNTSYYRAFNHDLLQALWFKFYPFIAWSSIYLGFKYYEEFNIQKLNADKAVSLAQGSQLEMLRYQLNPHFLFNTLSSLRALIRKKDNKTAEEMVTKISEFLKYSLLEGKASKVPLSREIKTINHYFDIEKVRFGDQLKIEYNIDVETEKFQIPVFLIHPLIENAVKHGMKTSLYPLKISINAQISNSNLLIEISNSGRWIERETNEDINRTGLQNTRKRLELAYPNNHTFVIMKKEDSVCIRIIINENSNS